MLGFLQLKHEFRKNCMGSGCGTVGRASLLTPEDLGSNPAVGNMVCLKTCAPLKISS